MTANQVEPRATPADDGKTAALEMLVGWTRVGRIEMKANDLDHLISALSSIRGGMSESSS
jgi:hypothetical protein